MAILYAMEMAAAHQVQASGATARSLYLPYHISGITHHTIREYSLHEHQKSHICDANIDAMQLLVTNIIDCASLGYADMQQSTGMLCML